MSLYVSFYYYHTIHVYSHMQLSKPSLHLHAEKDINLVFSVLDFTLSVCFWLYYALFVNSKEVQWIWLVTYVVFKCRKGED